MALIMIQVEDPIGMNRLLMAEIETDEIAMILETDSSGRCEIHTRQGAIIRSWTMIDQIQSKRDQAQNCTDTKARLRADVRELRDTWEPISEPANRVVSALGEEVQKLNALNEKTQSFIDTHAFKDAAE